MNIVEIDSRDKFSFNQFVAKNNGSFLQSWEWGEFQESLGRKVYRFAISEIIGGNAETVASVQFIKMPLPFGRYYLYAPYGPVVSGQWTVDSGRMMQELQKKFSDAVFVRIEPKEFNQFNNLASKQISKTKNVQPGKTLIMDLEKSEEEILAEMHHKTRYNIRLAQKHGVEIRDEFHLINGKGILAQEALELISATAGRQGYKAQRADYFEKLVDYFAVQNSKSDLRLHIYKAIHNRELLASAIILDFVHTRTYLFGGSSEEKKNLMAPYLLHFKAMLDAKSAGITEYDFWGIETSAGDTPGFVRFKLGFSSSADAIREYAGAYDIMVKPFEYKVYKMLRTINKILKRG